MFTFEEIKTLDAESFLKELNAPFTQGDIYSRWQNKRTVRRFVIKKGEEMVAYFQAVKFPLVQNKSYYYIPYGPVAKSYSPDLLKFIKESLNLLLDETVVYVRLDFSPSISDSESLKFLSQNFYKVPARLSHGSYFQPRQEWFLNIEKTLAVLLSEMHQKTRYHVRLAERKGVTTKIINANFQEYFSDFYRLMKVTAERGKFALHEEEYYKNVFDNLDRHNDGRSFLSIAYLGEEMLAIDLVIVFGDIANYVFGGSSNEHRNLVPTYLAQWAAIIQSKTLGCCEYNFGAVSMGKTSDWSGITDYKVKFGGHLVEHSDYYDLIKKPFWYFVYSVRKLLK
jgi:lipid II:glycine glycyltransferase (peptidoglycan interpeptide bridge formation enzyme)